MKTPLNILSEAVIAPLHNFRKAYLNTHYLRQGADKLSNFIYEHGKETDIMLLFFNALSIISSHIAQIKGLKKSDRENKDYLINQEKKELLLDSLLSVVPPFLLNKFLRKQLDGGKITTRSHYKKITEFAVNELGLSTDDLFNTEHIRPARETIVNGIHRCANNIIKRFPNMPNTLSNIISGGRDLLQKSKHYIGAGKVIPSSTEDIANALDYKFKDLPEVLGKNKFYNKNAHDDLSGMIEGLLILTSIAYVIVANNIVMPILKNKMANREYEKELAKKGETKESIKRKKRFSCFDSPTIENSTDNIFSNFNKAQTYIKKPIKQFNSFDLTNEIIRQSTGLKI
ncbi:hypothetical protein IJ182_06350 [bacterium]|nr:hypothetical protein [bacterium]